MKDQMRILDKTFEDWKGEHPQLDDVLVIGFRLGGKLSAKKKTKTVNWEDKTILIAEDIDVNFYLLTAVLKETKAKLIRVRDGQEAVDFVKNNEVDLVLMDINMPHMNGYDATKLIKEMRSDVPVIVQTALHPDDESDNAYEAGADYYIAKPVDLKTFIDKISRFLN
jgi:CheY-like chemotaxis protein